MLNLNINNKKFQYDKNNNKKTANYPSKNTNPQLLKLDSFTSTKTNRQISFSGVKNVIRQVFTPTKEVLAELTRLKTEVNEARNVLTQARKANPGNKKMLDPFKKDLDEKIAALNAFEQKHGIDPTTCFENLRNRLQP